MKCLQCDHTLFTRKKVTFSPEIKGETVHVAVPCHVCTHCDTPVMDAKQMNTLRKAAANGYRAAHGLLTSEQIVKYRQALGMAQTAFAKYLKVGEASIKRWETYYVQDLAQDEHMRLKCDEAYAEFNALEVNWKSHLPDRFNGMRRFSWERFKQALLYLLEVTKTPLFANKALFYIDFLHYKRHGCSITGARYIPLDYGPCPDQYSALFRLLLERGALKSAGKHSLKGNMTADLSLFDDEEKKTLQLVYDEAKKDGGKTLFELSHEEKAFKNTAQWKFINYDMAKELQFD